MAFDNLRLEKGMYQERGGFAAALERQDPSEQYRGTAMEGLDAYQRQLKRFDIRVKGAGSDVVAKFFQTADSSVLFPEYVSRAVRQGMDRESILSAITAAETRIEGMDYRSIYAVPDGDDRALRAVGEGAALPRTEIKTQSNLVRLHKRGRMLVASYEAIRFQKLDVFSVTLRQIGSYIVNMQVGDAVDVLVNGDGNGNAAAACAIGTSPIGGTAGTLSYDALVDFWSQFDPYEMNTMLVTNATMLAMLKLSAFQDPQAGMNFKGTGKPVTPLGANLLRAGAVPAGKLIGLDRNYALERVTSGDVCVEYDKLIDRQLERAAITSISGFAKLNGDACRVLTI